ncbi:MAG TPA: SDR family oxidoreductase [Candidatus Dormibacteraeota bacterium]|nr:SDR family oxidoreductase [Candidatus Dormibacteraeota bacterium]
MTEWRGRVCLVTGGSRGIGRATALAFGRRGATVVVNYRRERDHADSAVAAVEAAGGRGFAIQADIADPAAVEAMFGQIGDREGRLDVLVANAAASSFKSILDTHAGNIEKTARISLFGLFDLTQHAVELMREGGNIVSVSGWDAHVVVPGHGLLAAMKAATEAFTKYLAVEFAGRGIAATAVAPGVTETDAFTAYEAAQPGQIAAWRSLAPFGRFATPDDIAEIIAFLASREAVWLTGQTLLADGGQSLMTSPLPAASQPHRGVST